MAGKPSTFEGYSPELALEVRRMCLYVATILGDVFLDDVVVVGGLVPYLIVEQDDDERERHVGTRDLDLGLSLAVLDAQRYREISQRLRDRGFVPGTNEDGRTTRQTWRLPEERVTVDFLIPPTGPASRPGKLQSLEKDFAAIVTPALPLAFRDSVFVCVDDTTTKGERAQRNIRVCGPAAFVVLKAHALRLRGENKDAYDLVYVLQNFGDHVGEVAARFRNIAGEAEAQAALAFLAEDFASPEHVGPKRRARFLTGRDDPVLQADAYGLVAAFLQLITRVP